MRLRSAHFIPCVLASTACLHAWNETGHKVVGLIAYDRLTPSVRQAADDLLTAHPHYELLLKKDLPVDAAVNLWIFLQATTWPDLVRPSFGPNRKPEEITKYHRGDWHYLNVPYVWPVDAAQFPSGSLPPGSGTLLDAITNSRKIVADKTQPKAERAVHLAWLLHLIGDLHQPLHGAVMFSARTPNGDQGGNLVAVRSGGDVVRLHLYWDAALGTGQSIPLIQSIADGITSSHLARDFAKSLPELRRTTTPEAWVQESFADAVEYAYAKGRLDWRPIEDWDKRAETGVKATDFPTVDPDYAITAREIACRRAALAAVRLAELLDQLLR